jgi:hypothetical protein
LWCPLRHATRARQTKLWQSRMKNIYIVGYCLFFSFTKSKNWIPICQIQFLM